MKIIKRNGAEEVFDIKKIVIAVTKADSSSEGRSLTDSQIEDIAEFVEFKCNKLNRAVSVEEIQDLVEDQIMATGAFELAKRYGDIPLVTRTYTQEEINSIEKTPFVEVIDYIAKEC